PDSWRGRFSARVGSRQVSVDSAAGDVDVGGVHLAVAVQVRKDVVAADQVADQHRVRQRHHPVVVEVPVQHLEVAEVGGAAVQGRAGRVVNAVGTGRGQLGHDGIGCQRVLERPAEGVGAVAAEAADGKSPVVANQAAAGAEDGVAEDDFHAG